MEKKIETVVALLGGLLLLTQLSSTPAPKPFAPSKQPTPTERKRFVRPRPAPSPSGSPGLPQEGGRIAPDGVTQLQIDLPRECRTKNIGSPPPRWDGDPRSLGCCVFRSGEYAGWWGTEPEMYGLPEKMVKAGIEGGGYPEKVDKVFAKLAPHVQYVQDTSGDREVLKAILASGRPGCITYNGHDPHYGMNQDIAHMVCLVHFDGKWACISDNNFIEEDQFMWMSCDELVKRWKGGGGWVYCLLAPPPPPVPHN